ncbi:GNAT family N-acetyltransferase [Hyunsoonleella aestuarii]|uniref:N-acetyltransferase domain-containing protein n=1 Tax=Hyunsoonleella aestuarii TaxID=912802 RepID=A0ABP8E8L9_9FLAO|nr:GNAT family N-acetyltransferase [Hyunsoonleella aestuarii]
MKNLENSITYKRVTNNEELHQILELQQANKIESISKEERISQGFVTVNHSFDILKAMNGACAHIIAKSDSQVIGYALCMTQEFKDSIQVLAPMFKTINCSIKKSINYIIMGQICIEKRFRQQGVFRGLYNFMMQELNLNFDAVITEVDTNNKRSLYAHKAIGFELLKTYKSNNQEWELLIWHWE